MNQQARRASEFERTMLVTTTDGPEKSTLSRSPDNDPFLGAVLANTYAIEDVIGEGGMGRLYRARHLRLERPFAVKVIHASLSERGDICARFEREARLMSCVRSDHVVDIVDVVRAPDGRACIVSEFLDGQDLEHHLSEAGGKLGHGEAVQLARQCLWGLAAAHKNGVVHRDLKPANLFVVSDASARLTLKVLDFGVAKSAGDSEMTATGVIMGTPAYMAPEQARGASHADARSDLYAVGAVLYRMVTGRSPYSETDAGGTLVRLMQESPPRPSLVERTIGPGLEAVIERAMARDPAQRYQTAQEFDAALAPFDTGAPSTFTGKSGARSLDLRARSVRPFAVLTAVTLTLTTASAVATMLGLLVRGLSSTPHMNTTERVLVLLGAAVAGVGTGMAVGRSLASSWRNAAMVQARTHATLRALVGALVALVALELFALLWGTFAADGQGLAAPLWSAGRVLLALLVGCGLTLRAPTRDKLPG